MAQIYAALRRKRVHFRTMAGVIFGITLGVMFGLSYQTTNDVCFPYKQKTRVQLNTHSKTTKHLQQENINDNIRHHGHRHEDLLHIKRKYRNIRNNKKLVIIGIMTTKKFINSRAQSAFETWVPTIPGKVLFFSSEHSHNTTHGGLPVITLKGVDDTYPPQKKSFMMLKYMYEHFADEYEWFMRTDDDVYIKGDKLGLFLRSVKSSKPLYIGYPGYGRPPERLHLNSYEPYCIGGPGVVFSSTVLQTLIPNINACWQHALTAHEDVELGRCVANLTNIQCSGSNEMKDLFYQNVNGLNGSLEEVLDSQAAENAITLHPVKNHTHQYRVHTYFNSISLRILRRRTNLLQRRLDYIVSLINDSSSTIRVNRLDRDSSLNKFIPKSHEEVIPWDFMYKFVYSSTHSNPKRWPNPALNNAQRKVLFQVLQGVEYSSPLPRCCMQKYPPCQRATPLLCTPYLWSQEYKIPFYGYQQVNPLHGVSYIVDLSSFFSDQDSIDTHSNETDRHNFHILHQAFTKIEFREDDVLNSDTYLHESNIHFYQNVSPVTHSNDEKNLLKSSLGRESQKYDVNRYPDNLKRRSQDDDKTLHFIMTLSGRFKQFYYFMNMFESVVLTTEKSATLSVILFMDKSVNSSVDLQSVMTAMQLKYPEHKIELIHMPGPFSRGAGLEHGVSRYRSNDLLVFIDVDFHLHQDILQRFKLNTIQNKQVFLPIMFSQFDQLFECDTISENEPHHSTPTNYSQTAGFWRQFSYGTVAMCKSDFQKVGGFDENIIGWGEEDVKLAEAYITNNYTIFRAPDLGLIHLFHSKYCDPMLSPTQYKDCWNSRAGTYVSVNKLSEAVYKTKDIFHRDDSTHR